MANIPEPIPLDVRWLQPLDPSRLIDFPPEDFSRPLSRPHAEACEAWYQCVEEKAHAGLRPTDIAPQTERTFALAVQRLIAENVAYDANRQSNPVFTAKKVVQNIFNYYRMFPPGANNSRERAAYQNLMTPFALEVRREFKEVGVVLGLRRAFLVRRLVHPTRAMYGLLSAYGQVQYDTYYRRTITKEA